MTEKKKQAAKEPTLIVGARLVREERGDRSFPALIFRGEKLESGTEIRVQLENGSTYSGVVLDSAEADGEVYAELRDGLKPA